MRSIADGLITDPKTGKMHVPAFQQRGADAVEQPAVVDGQKEINEVAEFWRFAPKAWKSYFNIRDPKTIQQRAQPEIPVNQVIEGWPRGTDPDAHAEGISERFERSATGAHIHSGQR